MLNKIISSPRASPQSSPRSTLTSSATRGATSLTLSPSPRTRPRSGSVTTHSLIMADSRASGPCAACSSRICKHIIFFTRLINRYQLGGRGMFCDACGVCVHIKCRQVAEQLGCTLFPVSPRQSRRSLKKSASGRVLRQKASSWNITRRVAVDVIEARNLRSPSGCRIPLSPYVLFIGMSDDSALKTSIAHNTCSPYWSASFEVLVDASTESVFVELCAHDDVAYDEHMGLLVIKLGELIFESDKKVDFASETVLLDEWLPLETLSIEAMSGALDESPLPPTTTTTTTTTTATDSTANLRHSLADLPRLMSDIDLNTNNSISEVHIRVRTLVHSVNERWRRTGGLDEAVVAGADADVVAMLEEAAALEDDGVRLRSLLNMTDAHGFTPLHLAATTSNANCVLALLAHGASVNAVNKDGNTPFHYFCARWREPQRVGDLFEYLIDAGAHVGARNLAGETPLHKAVLNEYVRLLIVPLLLEVGAGGGGSARSSSGAALSPRSSAIVDVNAVNEKGETPLHYAIHLARADLVSVLLEAGADVHFVAPTTSSSSSATSSSTTTLSLSPLALAERDVTRRPALVEIVDLMKKVDELDRMLEAAQSLQYRSFFIRHRVFSDVWSSLDDSALEKLNISIVGHRMKLLAVAKAWRSELPPPPSLEPRRPLQSKLAAELSSVDGAHGGASTTSWLLVESDLEFTESIGDGTRGTVYRGLLKPRGNLEVAIKVISSTLSTEKAEKDFKKEFLVLNALRSPYTVKFYGASLEPRLCIVIEYCEKGSLYKVMNDAQERLGWNHFFGFSNDLLRGVDLLHNWVPPIVHRDLKSLNLLVNTDYRVKLCDFGLSRFRTATNLVSLRKCRGTLAYTAPEMMDAIEFKPSADVYSIGMVLWEMATRIVKGVYERPYSEFAHLHLDFQILIQASQGKRPSLSPRIPAAVRDMIARSWQASASARPSCAELLVELISLAKSRNAEHDAWLQSVAQKDADLKISPSHSEAVLATITSLLSSSASKGQRGSGDNGGGGGGGGGGRGGGAGDGVDLVLGSTLSSSGRSSPSVSLRRAPPRRLSKQGSFKPGESIKPMVEVTTATELSTLQSRADDEEEVVVEEVEATTTTTTTTTSTTSVSVDDLLPALPDPPLPPTPSPSLPPTPLPTQENLL